MLIAAAATDGRLPQFDYAKAKCYASFRPRQRYGTPIALRNVRCGLHGRCHRVPFERPKASRSCIVTPTLGKYTRVVA